MVDGYRSCKAELQLPVMCATGILGPPMSLHGELASAGPLESLHGKSASLHPESKACKFPQALQTVTLPEQAV